MLGPAPTQSFSTRSLWLIVTVAVFAVFLPSRADASIIVQNRMEAEVGTSVGPQFYDYALGSAASFSVAADFTTGTFVDTVVDSTGEFLQLAPNASVPADWWDADWAGRRCFKVENPGGLLAEHQVRLEIDTTGDVLAGLVQADGADYRALYSDNSAQLDLWVEGPMNDTNTVIWVQIDIPPGGQKFCLYYANPTATTVSSEAAVFTYSTPRQLYFPVNWRYDGSNGNQGTLDIVSFVDNNQVSVDGVTQLLNKGQIGAFTGVTADSVVLVTGPISGRGRGGGQDALVPISFAGTDMVFPTNRHVNRFSIVAPYGGTATVEIFNGTTSIWTGNVGSTVVSPTADISGGRSATIRSTNGVPILVTHTSTNGNDSLTLPPFFGDDIYGVRSRFTNIGVFSGPASVDIYRSDGTFQSLTNLAAGSETTISDLADIDGNGTAERFTNMSGFTGGMQQADRNGNESTSYLPERLLENDYYLPSPADYVAFACPVTTTIMVGAVTVNCTSPGVNYPGHGWIGPTPAGTRLHSVGGEPFFAYYEETIYQDETNLFGMKSAQSTTATPLTVTAGAPQVLAPGATSGTWTSPVIDTLSTGTNVFGLLQHQFSQPSGTAVRWQVASGQTAAAALAAPFVGPDQTPATFYTATAALPYGHDFTDQFFIIRSFLSATTAGTTPQVDAISLGYDLPEIATNPSGHSVATLGAAADTDWVVRVWVEDPAFVGSSTQLAHVTSSGLTTGSDARIRIDTTNQVEIGAGSLVQASGPAVPTGPGLAHSVIADTANMAGAVVDVRWETRLAGSGIQVHHNLAIAFN